MLNRVSSCSLFIVYCSLAPFYLCSSACLATDLPAGVKNYSATVVIPQHSGESVPPPFQATEPQIPAGTLVGKGDTQSVLRFAASVTGQLIKTEGYGEGHVGGWWNNNNRDGDLTLRSVLRPCFSGFAVDGQADFRSYPYAVSGAHGQHFVWRADGLCIQAAGFSGDHLRLFQIPGTAIVLRGANMSGQSGAPSIFDGFKPRLDYITISQAINGIDNSVGDSRLAHINITGVVKDGLILSGPGTHVTDCHVYGATRSCVISTAVVVNDCYFEAARVGTHILAGSQFTRIDGLDFGPGTCWYRGLLIESNSVDITGLRGQTAGVKEGNTDIAGVELTTLRSNVNVEGQILVSTGAIGIIVRGTRNRIKVDAGWGTNPQGIAVKVAEAVKQTQIECSGGGTGGTMLDLSESALDKWSGNGNVFRVYPPSWGGASVPVVYPGGGTKFKLAAGTEVWIDGVLQKRD